MGLPQPLFDLPALFILLKNARYQKGLWRLKISIDSLNKASVEIHSYKEQEERTASLKFYSKPFFEALAYVKKSDFSQRKKLLRDAQSEGFEDWVFYDNSQNLLETSIANIFWIDKKTLFIPDRSLPYYYGVTLDLVCECVQKIGLQVEEKALNYNELEKQNYIFICNSMKEIRAVSNLNGEKIDTQEEIIRDLLNLIHETAMREDALL
ncbi:MAG: hypothetical protein S4CHLAM7_11960 [Chlamydiae bacterium]|nr:hypothetical protein [Chlamydiota bacterium]